MATAPTNTRETYGAVGIREDLANIIYNISPTVISLIFHLLQVLAQQLPK